jgi:hypothetical protein
MPIRSAVKMLHRVIKFQFGLAGTDAAHQQVEAVVEARTRLHLFLVLAAPRRYGYSLLVRASAIAALSAGDGSSRAASVWVSSAMPPMYPPNTRPSPCWSRWSGWPRPGCCGTRRSDLSGRSPRR